MATEDIFTWFLKNKDEIQHWLFWIERIPTLSMPFMAYFFGKNLFYMYLICVPILIFTNIIYFGYSTHNVDNDDPVSRHEQKEMLPVEDRVERSAFMLERLGIWCLIDSCFVAFLIESSSRDPSGGYMTFSLIADAAIIFVLTNLMYIGCAISRIELDSEELSEGTQKKVTSQEKTFCDPEMRTIHRDVEVLHRNFDETLDKVANSKAIEPSIDGDEEDEVEEDLEDIELPSLEEYAQEEEDGGDSIEMMTREFLEHTQQLQEDMVENYQNRMNEMEKQWEEKLNVMEKQWEEKLKEMENLRTRLEQTNEKRRKRSREKQPKQMVGACENCREIKENLQKLWNEKQNLDSQICAATEKYENDGKNWEKEKQDLFLQISADTAKYEIDRGNWEKEKQIYVSQIYAANVKCQTYEDDRKNWKNEKQNLVSQIRAAKETYDDDRKNWELEKQNLVVENRIASEAYDDDREIWEEEKEDLVSQIDASTLKYETYKDKYEYYEALYNKQEKNRLEWEEEKNNLMRNISAADALCEHYESILNDEYGHWDD